MSKGRVYFNGYVDIDELPKDIEHWLKSAVASAVEVARKTDQLQSLKIVHVFWMVE